ncbi:MAG: Gfo/Idh/MocA family oxidoreductase [Anaerolineae bacterium]|nr:Gfo/Idh/MocA family oxidoreductase [Anaerolineae bacterium]
MRLAIMSFAHLHAEAYINNLRNALDVEFVGFSDLDAERGTHFAGVFKTKWYDSHEDLLKEGLDGVVICSENARHRELVEMAAGAGVPILCEKPIEVTLEDARAMRDVCKANNVTFMTAFPVRFSSSVQQVKNALDRGDLGRIYAINGINHSEIPLEHRAWFAQKALAGGGAVMDHTVHLVDAYRWFFGCEVVEVYAEVDNLFYRGEVDVDTAGIVTLTMENGVFATIDCSWSRPTFYPRWGHLKMDIVGEKGFMTLDGQAEHLTVYSKKLSRNPTWMNYGNDSNQHMINEFVAAIRENREPAVTWRDGYEAVRVALACFESAESGQPVRLEVGQ